MIGAISVREIGFVVPANGLFFWFHQLQREYNDIIATELVGI